MIIGNNPGPFNNHLDILDIIASDSNSKYKFILPFNYGRENNYSKIVRNRVKQINNTYLIENFLPYQQYVDFFKQVKAAVFNCYRQMAMANVFFSLQNGVKLYLSPKNPVYEWLINNNLLVFNIDDFENDLKSDNLSLSENEILFNKQKLLALSYSQSVSRFHENIVNCIST